MNKNQTKPNREDVCYTLLKKTHDTRCPDHGVVSVIYVTIDRPTAAVVHQ